MEGEGEIDIALPTKKDAQLLHERFERKMLDFEHGRLAVRNVEPENKRDMMPLVSTLGFGTGNVALQHTISELFYSGEHVIEVDFIGGGKGVRGEEGSSSEYNRQGMLMAEFMDNYFSQNPHIEKMDIMAQSSALFRVLALAKLRPDLLPKIRNILLTSPSGLNEKDSHLGLLKRFRAEGKRYKESEKGLYDSENDANLKIAFNETVKPYPIKTLKEINAMARANQYPTLEVLKTAGIKIGVLQGADDKIVPIQDLADRIAKDFSGPEYSAFKKIADTETGEVRTVYNEEQMQGKPPVDILRIVAGGHGIQVDDPKHASKMILETIDHLNKMPRE